MKRFKTFGPNDNNVPAKTTKDTEQFLSSDNYTDTKQVRVRDATREINLHGSVLAYGSKGSFQR